MRKTLLAAVRYAGLVGGLAVLFVLLDFMIDVRPPQVQDSYRFRVDELAVDQPRILRQDNLSIVVIKRSDEMLSRLRQSAAGLQDPESRHSRQPAFADNPLRSKAPEMFVSYAIGTHYGCVLEVIDGALGEVCSNARYDYAGRALQSGDEYPNLPVPDYNFSDDFSQLTVRP